jgi:hypothetical protein
MDFEAEASAGADTPVESVESAEPADSSSAAQDWDGSLESLVNQPWVPETARSHLERHLDDYTTTRTRADFLHRLFEADDRTADMARELDTLRQAMSAAEKERDEWRGKASTYEEQFREVEEDREYDRLKNAYPDIFEDCHADEKNPEEFKGAWPMFLDLTVRGYDEETAAKLARAMLPATAPMAGASAESAPTKRDVAIPPSVKAASRGGNNPSSTVNAAEANETFDQRVKRMMAEARDRGE